VATLDKLLALKAFYLGHGATQSPLSKSDALRMVDAALQQLQSRHTYQDKVRRAFYHLLRAEIHRQGGDPIPDRVEAQRICAEIVSPLYEYFMQVEAVTQGRTINLGKKEVSPYTPPVTSSKTVGSWYTTRIDLAAEALEVDESLLTKSEFKFLKKISLRQLLEKHKIEFLA
jgi:hypothetical protein